MRTPLLSGNRAMAAHLLTPFGILLVFAATGAVAHAHLKASVPAEGALLLEAPASVALTFSEGARITAAWLQKDQEPKQALKPSTGSPAVQISVPLPRLAAGSYTMSWRVVSDDTHIMSGELHFKVAAPETKATPH